MPAAIRHDFPHEVETIDPLWITLADGTRLAATLWRPVTAKKVPCVVEMLRGYAERLEVPFDLVR